MSLTTFLQRFTRRVAAVGAGLLATALAIGLASVDLGDARFGMLWLIGTGVATLVLGVLAVLPRVPIAATWLLFLVAAWAVAAANGPGVVGGIARGLGWTVAGACVVMAVAACIRHYDVAQNRPVSRL